MALRAIDKWLPGYLRHVMRGKPRVAGPRDLLFCVADHFEPFMGGAGRDVALDRVRRWADDLPQRVAGHHDADGRSPIQTLFYPADEYDPECLDRIGDLCAGGVAEVEVHLHHRKDTEAGLTEKLEAFKDVLHRRHGLLGTDGRGHPRYAFIHGNWALCNSLPGGDWCGVNEELSVLSATGCYVDMTFPSAPSPTQSRVVNSIYRAMDRPGAPRGFDHGLPVRAADGAMAMGASPPVPPGLMLISGPLALNWQRRKWAVLPRLETGDLTGVNPADPLRARLWVRQNIHVVGRPEWVFVKLHTHGCRPANTDMLLGPPMTATWRFLESAFNDGQHWRLHFVSAREMYNIARAAEDGRRGNAGDYRDYEIRPPGRGAGEKRGE